MRGWLRLSALAALATTCSRADTTTTTTTSSTTTSSAAGTHPLCCTWTLATPTAAAGEPPPAPGTRFEAARVTGASCAPAALCGAARVALLPGAGTMTGRRDSSSAAEEAAVRVRLAVPAACAPLLDAPVSAPLVPRGGWLHFAGDSLLRGEFTTLATYFRGGRWEPWLGARAPPAMHVGTR